MIVYFEFDYDKDGDKELHEIYQNAERMYSVLHDIDQHLRSEAKYKDNEAAEKIREELREYMFNQGISHLF